MATRGTVGGEMANTVTVKDKGWKKLKKGFKSADGKGIAAHVGVQGAEAGQALDVHNFETNVVLATIHEFGSTDGKIPERSFLRSTFDTNQKKYEKAIDKATTKLLDGKRLEGELFLVGEQYREDIIKRIRSGIPPKLADSTMKGRGSGPPLWDTGQLVNSLTTVVKK